MSRVPRHLEWRVVNGVVLYASLLNLWRHFQPTLEPRAHKSLKSSFRRNNKVLTVRFHRQINALSQRKHYERTKPNINREITKWLKFVDEQQMLSSKLDYGELKSEKLLEISEIKVKITIQRRSQEKDAIEDFKYGGNCRY